MKCPLFGIHDHERKGNTASVAPDCLEAECAWWDESQSQCTIKMLVRSAERISFDITQALVKLSGRFDL